ncbi:unnamed protein product [Danaus chrysippus]|uniref:(African queen) hypothetical protein n=1 Tax=Danaus chrysippus TaxID=151541 RepID=A0A8J2QT53_9NEOP|nr:unnamed protein product [Danaus chrysippus]
MNTQESNSSTDRSCPLWERLNCVRAASYCRRKLRKVAPEDGLRGKNKSKDRSRRTQRPPTALYNRFSEKMLSSTPPALQCALFCGGRRCQYERPENCKSAIQGLYSDWVTDEILAMARPSTASIAARNIIQQFHSWGIRTVINLQTPGEHASCGPPLTSSGFTYDPNVFMTNDIYYYNFAWPDYGEASLSSLLDMVKVLSFSFQEGRVAIHCHAGLGRTGVLIACYLVYALRIKADDAIRLVRKRRPRSVQMSCQIFCVQQFQHYLLPQTVVFSCKEQSNQTKDPRTSEFTLRQYLYRQMATLHGADERAFREIPKIVYCLCERLLYLCGCCQTSGVDLRVRNRPFYKNFISHRLKQRRPPEVNEDIQTGQVTSLPMVEWRDPVEEEVERNLESVSRLTGTRSGVIPAIIVYEAFMTDHQSLPEERRKHLQRLKASINQRSDFDKNIDEEEDPVILSGLLFEWLEGLKEPVLDKADLAIIITSHDLENTIQALDTEDVILVEYLLRVVLRLRPLTAPRSLELIRRVLASLTHQTLIINDTRLPAKELPALREGTHQQLVNFMLKFLVEIQKDIARPGNDDLEVVAPQRRYRIKRIK